MTRDLERRLSDAEEALCAAAGRPVVIELLPGESQQAARERAGAENATTIILLERIRMPYPDDA